MELHVCSWVGLVVRARPCTPCTCSSPVRVGICLHHRTPCTCSSPVCAGISMPCRTLYTGSFAVHAGISSHHRNPCAGSSACRLCAHSLAPPHSLHVHISCPCRHNPTPPHSLPLLLTCLCRHIDALPHSLYWLFCRPCGHILAPPQSLHRLFCCPCTHSRRHKLCLQSGGLGGPRGSGGSVKSSSGASIQLTISAHMRFVVLGAFWKKVQ